MSKKSKIEIKEEQQERIKTLFKEFVSDDDIYKTWANTFEIEISSDNTVFVYYYGEEKTKLFKEVCKSSLYAAIYTVVGEGYKVKIKRKRIHSAMSPRLKALKFFVLGMLSVCMATAVIVVLYSYIENRNFRETFYSTSSIKVDTPIRVVHLSDLHGSSYGRKNKNLILRIKELSPDIIICTGDIVDSIEEDLNYAVNLAKELAAIAPTYYVYGNNEVEEIYGFPFTEKALDKEFGFDETNRDEKALIKFKDTYEKKLQAAGRKVLKNEKDTMNVNHINVDVYGVLNSNPSSFWSYSENAFTNYIYENSDNLKITAVHEPFIFETFQPEYWGDLMLCGHTHGGVIRVPVIGPLYTREGGLFPERSECFVYGRYNTAGKVLIVSAGLENSCIFRMNNQPEIVIIDINKY
jgi:predicted MPP superfamily phosphohydrolase